jgi:hypothetical protein
MNLAELRGTEVQFLSESTDDELEQLIRYLDGWKKAAMSEHHRRQPKRNA